MQLIVAHSGLDDLGIPCSLGGAISMGRSETQGRGLQQAPNCQLIFPSLRVYLKQVSEVRRRNYIFLRFVAILCSLRLWCHVY